MSCFVMQLSNTTVLGHTMTS